jgi:hypothetical protein
MSLISVNRAAKMLGISRRRLREIVKQGVIVEVGGVAYRASVGVWAQSKDCGLTGPSGVRIPASHLKLIRMRRTTRGPANPKPISAAKLLQLIEEVGHEGQG